MLDLPPPLSTPASCPAGRTRRLVGRPWADAVEIAQDSFAEAWLKCGESCRGDWHDVEVFGRWLRGVARNRYRNWVRGRRRERLRIMPLADAAEHAVVPCDPELFRTIGGLAGD